jgi:hypothetical protein
VYVYDRAAKPVKVWPLIKNINFVETIKDDGTLVGRRDLKEGKHENLCPAIAGGISWNAGSYNPKTGWFYKIGYEWCIDLEVVKTTPILEPMAQLNIGADFKFVPAKGESRMYAHVDARDPITGKVAWSNKMDIPPHASLLSTGDSARLGCEERQGALDPQQRHGPQRRHHYLLRQGQAVRGGHDRLG